MDESLDENENLDIIFLHVEVVGRVVVGHWDVYKFVRILLFCMKKKFLKISKLYIEIIQFKIDHANNII